MAGDRVLVVEDDSTIGQTLVATLRSEGYDAVWCANGADAIRDARANVPAVVLLDLGLPDHDGIAVCRELRLLTPQCHIVMLTARSDEIDVVVGLDAGADDYVIKPFRLPELLARVRAHVRRSPDALDVLVVDDLRLDLAARRAWIDGREVELRPKEFDVLTVLARSAGAAVTREHLIDEVWDEFWNGSTKTLDMHILGLRRKLDGARAHIVTFRGIGYRLDP